MQYKDSSNNYGLTSILFHWLTTLLIIGLFIMGQVMEEMQRGPEKGELRELHQSVGMVLLGLVFIRLVWRISQGFPEATDTSASFLNLVSKLWHWALLILIIAIPISGYIASESGFRDVPFFGLFTFPDILASDHELHEQFEDVHEVLVKILVPLVIIHVLAALKHHFWNKDATLMRMLRVK
ncbi:MAG: cytochrome b [Rhodospirillaceae bacterium]|jgi:cytochrome b561|nr:cytochrome b [Rhodospirillaceae bacterium]MBT4589018.1 cytochrome b [Rhodospirillaceae bacterium]MBT5941473.1 cytochrome b [Rhodospirillaceae bacterium]MBT7265283.1 cytochrome b [Rhodospirillaceae bacterium]